MDPPSPGGLKPLVGGPFSFSAAVAGSTVDQVVSTRPAGGLVLSQERPGPGPGRDGRAGGHAPCACHPGCGLVGGPGPGLGPGCGLVLDRPGCRLALVVGSSSASFRGCDLHVCILIDILGVNRGCCGDFFLVVFGLVGGCFGGVQALCLVGCVSDRSPGALPWFSFRAHTAPGRQEPATPPRSGRETRPGSRSLPGLTAGGDPPGRGRHSYPRSTDRREALRPAPGN